MLSPLLIIIIVYLIIMNIAGFATMGVDKSRAKKGAWRIPEATLFLVALLGGSIGSILGMQHFRHKIKHWYFVVGMPVIFFVQLALAIFIILKF